MPAIGLLALLAGVGSAGAPCDRPYSGESPWNTPVSPQARVIASSDDLREVLRPDPDTVLTSDPEQYTYPVYYAGKRTPRVRVRTRDWYSRVHGKGRRLENRRAGIPRVPLPRRARPAAGTDAQIIVIDRRTGAEWNLSEVSLRSGRPRARNVGRYNLAWSGVPPRASDGDPWWLRGAGVPYLAGLVRPCEIALGRIPHALALAHPRAAAGHVHPATKSDGLPEWSISPNARGFDAGGGLPEGSRLQLDPSITEATIRGDWGCDGACLTIARALQDYGMYLIDSGNRPKVMVEYEGTARWRGAITAETVSPIPLTAFRLVEEPPG